MALDPDDPKVRLAMLGKQVEYFLESDIGRLITDRAQSEAADGVEEFKNADPFNGHEIARIQARVKLADSVITWLAETIEAGKSSTFQLEVEQAEK